ncbi:MAG: hypothetical protein AB7S75_10235 [Desulfococcaceae bacterium]
MNLRTCVAPSGHFVWGIHRPCFRSENFREHDSIYNLGIFKDGSICENRANFPTDTVQEDQADPIYEIPNPFPFRGTTYIIKSAADRNAANPSAIRLPERTALSLSDILRQWQGKDLTGEKTDAFFHLLPVPLMLALAANSTDPEDLTRIADFCCEFVRDPKSRRPVGLVYDKDAQGRVRPRIKNHDLCEVLANNIFLPDDYKEVMVLRPGVQGNSEIMGEWREQSHVFEYLRRNSYIPWGHYAANMANDKIRYRACDLTSEDMQGMRHLYYQRTYARLAEELEIPVPAGKRTLTVDELEDLRKRICDRLSSDKKKQLTFNSTLWGWNFGFDYSPSGYRLHASHQQIHQQYAMIPSEISAANPQADDPKIPAFAFGDLIAEFICTYREQTGMDFFDAYTKALGNNTRTDGRQDREHSLVIYEDNHVLLFVPKAQTSQWELQLMAKYAGNILEADTQTRVSLDQSMRLAVQVLEKLGARMITHIEASKRFDAGDTGQRLLYCFLPKLPYSPGSFTEAQLRWINGHYPEDFAALCRSCLPK